MEHEAEIWSILHELDDPEHLEYPPGYDHGATRARFDRLAARLEADFQCTCYIDRDVQDASHHGRIVIPAEHTNSGESLTIVVSNFGRLVVATLGNPGSCDAEETASLLHTGDRIRLSKAFADLDLIEVPENLLWSRYDGRSGLGRFYQPRNEPTWYIRFFDYL